MTTGDHMTRRADTQTRRVHVERCPVCDSPERRSTLKARDAVSLHEFDLVRCRVCGAVYVDPRPDDEALGTYYADYYGGGRHPFLKDLFMAARARKLGRAPRGGRLLDYGCGRGDFLLAARRHGWEGMGVERSGTPIMELRENLGLTILTPDALGEVPDASFDAITLWHVLEHLPEPRVQLTELHRLLRPGGRLLVEVPNFGGWLARIGGDVWYHLDVPRHLIHFDRGSLAHLLRGCGFEIARWGTMSIEYDIFGLVQSMLNRVCRQPNHLFQLIINEPSAGGPRDTAMSVALLPPLAVASGALTLAAGATGRGGVLRVWARKGRRA